MMGGIELLRGLCAGAATRPASLLLQAATLYWLGAGGAQADIIDSESCPGALEDRTTGGSVLSRVIPTGGTARCVSDPEPALGLEPFIRGEGGGITLIIDPDVLIPTFRLEGDGNILEHGGLASGTMLGNGAQISTAAGSDLELAVSGNGTIVENIGALILDSIGDLSNVANGGFADLSLTGDGASVRNDPDAIARVFVAGSEAVIDNLGQASSVEVNGDDARIFNEGSTGSGLDGAVDGLGLLVVGQNADVVNVGQIAEFSEPGLADGALGIAVVGDSAGVANQAGSVVVEGVDSVAIGVEGDGADIVNSALVGATGTDATGVFVEGNGAVVVNQSAGEVNANGSGTTGISVEGVGADVENRGEISVAGDLASGVFVAGSGAQVRNVVGATIDARDGAVLAAGVFGDAATVTNSGSVATGGRNALGLAIVGLGAELTNAGSGVIATQGANADALVLGLQGLPPGAEGLPIPPGALDSAQGGVTNEGSISTSGIGADGINAFADGSTISNVGTIDTDGNGARGIAVVGTANLVRNGSVGGSPLSGVIRTTGPAGHAIQVGAGAPGSEAGIENHGLLQTRGGGAHGIRSQVYGSIENHGLILVDGSGSTGIVMSGSGTVDNLGFIRAGDPQSGTVSGAGGIEYSAADTVINAADAEIVVFGVSGKGIFQDTLAGVIGATVDNAGTITITGDDGVGVSAIGGAANQPLTSIGNTGLIRAGVDGLLMPDEPEDPDQNPSLSPPERAVGILTGGHAEVVNDELGRIRVLGMDSAGVVARAGAPGSGLSVINRGQITASGGSAAGMDLTGDNVHAFNGSLGDTANIVVSGSNSVGIRTSGTDQFVTNSGILQVTGSNSTLIEVTVTGPGELWVDSSTALNVGGRNGIAMDVRSGLEGAELRITDSASQAINCTGGGLAGGRIINCGGIDLGEHDSAVGMRVSGIADTFVENQAGIVGSGGTQRGMVIEPAAELTEAEGQVNFVENLADIRLTGNGSTGVVINGSGNFLLNGTGVTTFDLAPGLPEALTGTIASNIDKMVSRGTALGPVESEQIGAQGIIEVTGIGSRGLLVGGTSNLISNRLSQVFDGENFMDLPGTIVASGFGSIGVELQGSGHVLDNEGLIQGDQFAIFADDGAQTVVNKNTIAGAVALGGGDDNLVFIPGASFGGPVDGGDGLDHLRMLYRADADIDDELVTGNTMDGDQFAGFERFTFDLEFPVSTATLENTLAVDRATISSGVLVLNDAFLNSPDIRLEGFTALTGNGMLGSEPSVAPGAFGVRGNITIADQATVGAGNSPGTLTFLGDVASSGLFEMEIGGIDVALYDTVNVTGDLTFLGGGIDIQFIDGFLPSVGDTFDLFDVSGMIAGLESLEVTFSGLRSGYGFDFSFSPGGLSLATLAQPGASVPEPGTVLLMLAGLAALLASRRRMAR